MKRINFLLGIGVFGMISLAGCGDSDVPEAENEEEIITDVVLTFTPSDGGAAITAAAQDPDGEGPEELEIIKDIELAANTTYVLTLELENSVEGESITEEIAEEDEEHMFFFGWTSGLFTDPSGDGNIGANNGNDPLNYNDEDGEGLPVGLSTTWTTGDAASGTFRVLLKHQPDIKSATVSSADGESDVDITWDLTIE